MVWGGGSASRVREHHAAGALVVAWREVDPSGLEGVTARPLEALLGDSGLAAARAAARTWSRLWGRIPLMDGESFRDLVVWRETSLLWLAEGFLFQETAGPRCAALAETALRLLDTTGAGEVDVVGGLSDAETLLLARACTVRGVLFHGPTPQAQPLPAGGGERRRGPGRLRRLLATGRPPALPAPWASGAAGDSESLLLLWGGDSDPIPLRPLLEDLAVGLGLAAVAVRAAELDRWKTREVRRRSSEAHAHLRERYHRLHGTPGLQESYRHGGVGFEDLAAKDLEALLLVHLPAMVGQMEAAIELLAQARPAGVVVAGAGRDERRALVAACRAAGVPAIILRTGPEDLDRDDGGPRAAVELEWSPGSETAPVVARLRPVVRAKLGPE